MHDSGRAIFETDRMVGEAESAEHREFLEVLGGLLRGENGPRRARRQEREVGVAWGGTARLSAGPTGLGWRAAQALAGGERNENTLTDLIFFERHPERGGRSLRTDERDLVREWLQIRDTLVRPALRALTPSLVRPVLRGTTPGWPSPSTPTGPSPSPGGAGTATASFRVSFTHDPPPRAPDHSRPRPRPGPAGGGPDLAGYTTTRLDKHISIEWDMGPPGTDGRVPLFIRSVNVCYHLGMQVFVSSDYAVGSCPYRVTLAHENSHAQAFVRIYRAARKALVRELKGIDVPTRVTPALVASNEVNACQEEIGERVEQVVSTHSQRLVGAMTADRNAKDSAATYRAVYAQCPANTW